MRRLVWGLAVCCLLAPLRPAAADLPSERQLLQRELARLTANPQAGAVHFPDGRTLHPGDRDPAVLRLRQALAQYGYPADAAAPDDAALYDDLLAGQVRRFQLEVGLVPDAAVGPETRKAFRFMDGNRLLMLAQSLAQPDPPLHGRTIVVNIAAATLTAREDARTVLFSRVVVGNKDNQTPVFSARIDAVWVNPLWVVPQSIADKEFGGNAHIEKPGPANPLGQMLLELPNQYAVFLHDTNQPYLLDSDERPFSHGCVRVKQIQAVERWLLGDQRWADEGLGTALRGLASKRYALDQSVAIYLQYRTATLGPTGAVIYHPDPYGLAAPPPPAPVEAAIAAPGGPAAPAPGPASPASAMAPSPAPAPIPVQNAAAPQPPGTVR